MITLLQSHPESKQNSLKDIYKLKGAGTHSDIQIKQHSNLGIDFDEKIEIDRCVSYMYVDDNAEYFKKDKES